jgi:hypothetical protein
MKICVERNTAVLILEEENPEMYRMPHRVLHETFSRML